VIIQPKNITFCEYNNVRKLELEKRSAGKNIQQYKRNNYGYRDSVASYDTRPRNEEHGLFNSAKRAQKEQNNGGSCLRQESVSRPPYAVNADGTECASRTKTNRTKTVHRTHHCAQ